jgi:hypothetical protein
LSIQKVLNGDLMRTLEIDGGVLELLVTTHELLGVLVAKSSHVLINGGSGLFRYQSQRFIGTSSKLLTSWFSRGTFSSFMR